MVWFSQVIGLDRGLEEFLTCLQLIPTIPVAINLVGLASDDVKSRVNELGLSHQPESFDFTRLCRKMTSSTSFRIMKSDWRWNQDFRETTIGPKQQNLHLSLGRLLHTGIEDRSASSIHGGIRLSGRIG